MQLEPALVKQREKGTEEEDKEQRSFCLDGCVAKLKKDESGIITTYFSEDGSRKIEARRRLAEKLNITMGNLHIRVHRLKKLLRECMDKCLDRG